MKNRSPWVLLGLLPGLLLAPTGLWAQSTAAAPPQSRDAGIRDKLPDWLTLGAVYRFRAEGRTGIGYQADNEDAYGLSRLLINVGVKPKSWLKFQFQGQDSRSPGIRRSTPFFRDPFDVRQAYVEIGENERGWLSVRAGRQELLYGAQRLIGPLNWGNTSRQFDAVKATIGKKDASVDVFAASVVRIDDKAFNKRRDGENLHGIYGRFAKLFPRVAFEPYLLWKTQPSVVDESGLRADADIYTAGFRLVRPAGDGFDYSMELARQFGTFGGGDVSAWAGYWILGYTPAGAALSPRLSAEYSYAGGDDDPTDGKRGTFDQLFPTGHLYHGLADRVGWRNISDVRTGLELSPHGKVKLAFNFYSFWLAERQDHLYGAGGAIAVRGPAGGAADSHIGTELDATLAYRLSRKVTLGGGYGYLFPGAFLKENTPGFGTSFPYIFCNWTL